MVKLLVLVACKVEINLHKGWIVGLVLVDFVLKLLECVHIRIFKKAHSCGNVQIYLHAKSSVRVCGHQFGGFIAGESLGGELVGFAVRYLALIGSLYAGNGYACGQYKGYSGGKNFRYFSFHCLPSFLLVVIYILSFK